MRLLLLDKPTNEALHYMREEFTIVKKNPNIIYTQLTPISCDVPVFCPCTGIEHIKSPKVFYLYDKEWLEWNIYATAEHTFALILSLCKHLDYHFALCEEKRNSSTPLSWDLHGRRLLIVGNGRVGRQVGRMAKSFGMIVDTVEKGDMLPLIQDKLEKADIVTFHIGLTDNEGRVDYTWFDHLKKGTIVVNTSRGGIFDENAVARSSNRIKFALDTCEDYSSEVLQKILDNGSVITPHVGGWSDKSRELTDMWILEKMIDYKRRKG